MRIPPITRRRFLAGTAAATAAGFIPPGLRAQTPRVLNARMYRDIQVLDPGYMIGGVEETVEDAILPRLADTPAGDTWKWVPTEFVESLGHTDDTHIAFKLRPGLMWSDGHGELTAEDVKFSFERMKESEWSGKWEALDHVNVTGTHSGELVMVRPFAPFWLTALSTATGAVVCKAAFEKLGITQYTTDLPAQLGPYRIREWLPKERLVLETTPDWPLTRPDFGVVNYLHIADDNSAELAYEAGEVDFTEITMLSLTRYQQNPPEGTQLKTVAGLVYTWMGMNTEHPNLSDIRVRKAIQRAVDTDSVLEAAYGGLAPKSYGIVPPGLIGKRNESKYSYNPQEASELLQAAGVSNLSLTLQTLNLKDRVTAAQIIQANLAEVGLQVEVIPLDSGPFWNLGQESKGDAWKDLQLWIMRYGGSPDPFDHFQWFVRDQVGVWNWERWSTDEFDALYKSGIEESDIDERNRIYLRMGEIMEDTGPTYGSPMSHRPSCSATGCRRASTRGAHWTSRRPATLAEGPLVRCGAWRARAGHAREAWRT